MNIIVTCGPSYEPIDQVRRITNFSTGRLGITLANAFTAAGHQVHCFKGDQATDPTPVQGRLVSFSTNDSLLRKLKAIAMNRSLGEAPSRTGEAPVLPMGPIDAVFHAAALCDFKPVVQSTHQKIPTKTGVLTLQLEPTVKVLPQLRSLFPDSLIVGWKYELDGDQNDAIRKGLAQIHAAKSDACVVNGSAYALGHGFGFCQLDPKNLHHHIQDLDSLCAFLIDWTINHPKRKLPPL